MADNNNWLKGNWEAYKNNQALQDESFRKLVEINFTQGESVHHGNKEKMLGFAMAAHLKGAGNALKWYAKKKDSKDGNGTRTSDYARFGEQTARWINPVVVGNEPMTIPVPETQPVSSREDHPVSKLPAAKLPSAPAKKRKKKRVIPQHQLSDVEKASIQRVAANIGVNPNDLAAVISFETAGTFSPAAKNPKSSATGLIQFMRGSGNTKGAYYGMTREQFSALSFDQQMHYVEKYFKDRNFKAGKHQDVANLYTAVTGYGYKAKTKAYEDNKVWDSNHNGVVEKGEMVRNPSFRAHQRNYFTDVSKPEPVTSKARHPVPAAPKPSVTGASVPAHIPFRTPSKVPLADIIPRGMNAVQESMSIRGDKNDAWIQDFAKAVSSGEGNYNSVNRGLVHHKNLGSFETDLSKKTIKEVIAANNLKPGNPLRMNAVGKYQIIRTTMEGLVKQMGLTGNEKLTPEMQDKLFKALIPSSATNYMSGKSNNKQKAMLDLAKVWASIAVPVDTRVVEKKNGKKTVRWVKAGRSYYDGDGGNSASPKATRQVSDIMDRIRQMNMEQGGYKQQQNPAGLGAGAKGQAQLGLAGSNQAVAQHVQTSVGTINIVTQANDNQGIAKGISGSLKQVMAGSFSPNMYVFNTA